MKSDREMVVRYRGAWMPFSKLVEYFAERKERWA